MSPKSVNNLCMLILFAGGFISLLAAYFVLEWLLFVGLAVVMASVFLRITFYRCPHCGKKIQE